MVLYMFLDNNEYGNDEAICDLRWSVFSPNILLQDLSAKHVEVFWYIDVINVINSMLLHVVCEKTCRTLYMQPCLAETYDKHLENRWE